LSLQSCGLYVSGDLYLGLGFVLSSTVTVASWAGT